MLHMRKLADANNPNSLSSRLRAARFERFERFCAPLARPLRILDVGGTVEFWEQAGWSGRSDISVVLANHVKQQHRHRNITSIVADATALDIYEDGSFDIVFSNSVIEHLFDFEAQHRMAEHVQRLGQAYWVQTPNFWFPMEPHFHVPGWQWMPQSMRTALIRRFRCGWRGPCPDPDDARKTIDEVRLLTKRQLHHLFPNAEIVPEYFYGMVKSWIVRGRQSINERYKLAA